LGRLYWIVQTVITVIPAAFVFATYKKDKASNNQMKLGIDYPFKLDEPDTGFSEGHRTRLLQLLSSLIEQKII